MRTVSEFFSRIAGYAVLAFTLLGCGIEGTKQPSASSAESRAAICQPVATVPVCYEKDGSYVLEAWSDDPRHCDYKGPLPKNYEKVAYDLCKDLPGYNPPPFGG